MIIGASRHDKSGITAKQTRNGTVLTVKRTPTIKRTPAQDKQREKFCRCDDMYRRLSPWQQAQARRWAADYNNKHKTNYSPHTVFMKHCLDGNLNHFFEHYLGMTFQEFVEHEGNDKTCYTLYVKPAPYIEKNEDDIIFRKGGH